jgi:hypothetical protein
MEPGGLAHLLRLVLVEGLEGSRAFPAAAGLRAGTS